MCCHAMEMVRTMISSSVANTTLGPRRISKVFYLFFFSDDLTLKVWGADIVRMQSGDGYAPW